MHDFNKIKLSLHLTGKRLKPFSRQLYLLPIPLFLPLTPTCLTGRESSCGQVLAILSAYVCGTPGPLTHAVAAVAEMLHTASLLHDDVADNADTRRGGWSVQKLFGAQASILLGDFWFARAFQLLLDYEGRDLLPLYAEAIRGLSEGELFQMEG
jgi:hypothetical protein